MRWVNLGRRALALKRLLSRLLAPRALRDIGLTEPQIPKAVALIQAVVPQSNPLVLDEQALTSLLHAAWAGEPPRSIT